MSCDAERVTGFVDGELDESAAAAVAAHIESCATCREQAEAERALRARLHGVKAPELPAGLESRIQAARRRRPAVQAVAARWALPLAALLVIGVWLRGYAPFVAWDLARDHDKCFTRHPLPAKVWSSDPRVVAEWFEAQGTRMPGLPAEVGELRLVGARYCPLLSLTMAPHVYYASSASHVSVFVVPQGVRLDGRLARRARNDAVHLLRLADTTLGLVGEHEADLAAFETALQPVVTAQAMTAPGREVEPDLP